MITKIKKIFLAIIFIFGIFSFNFNYTQAASCTYNENSSLSNSLENCFSDSKLVKADNLKVDSDGFKEKINDWKNRIAFYLGIFAVIGIVFSGFKLVTSAGEEEKISQAKNVFKWAIIGLLVIMFAAAIITLVINIFYSI